MGEEIESVRSPRFTIYRGADARSFAEHDVMPLEGVTPTMAEGLAHFQGAGAGNGQVVKLLYAAPGFSLTYVWFKSGGHAGSSSCRMEPRAAAQPGGSGR